MLRLTSNPAALNDPNYVRAWSVLADADLFDASFFGFTPREAEITDPQHRLFLECAWEAVENAGYDAQQFGGSIAVYAGASMNTYLLYNLQAHGDLLRSEAGLQMIIGNDKDYLATRVSYKLDLTGPSVAVQTSCSTSLVAVHLACRSLLGGECDMALAGGVTLRVPQTAGYLYQEGHILSPDGHCRAFDARAQGTVWGSGVGIVVLKRLEDALTDGDCIRAVVKGTAINNDGAFKIGYTAPSVDRQARMIAQALAVAEISPETISYIEAHGTGTPLGDPIEIAALTQAFRARTDKQGFCAIGSAKTNIGHLGAAAGVTGLIKTVLALEHKELPPSLHFEQPNPRIDFANSPFHVQTALSEWKVDITPRRAGISSFGMGGTNAHAILEEAPRRELAGASRRWKLLVLSAKTRSALEQTTKNIVVHLKKTPGLDLADVAHTLQVGRKGFSHRRMLVCSDLDDALAALETLDPKRVVTNFQDSRGRSIVFMFPGQGTQHVNMGRDLYENEATFRQHVDHCSELLKANLKLDLRDVLYPNESARESATRQINKTAIAQPALFVIEYALAKLWMEWGIRPEAMIGHSVGEYVAACLAEVLSLEDTLTLLGARGRLIEQVPGGAMLAVPLPQQEIDSLLGPGLSLAAINAPSLCVVSGPTNAVESLANELADKDVPCRRLETSHAFHSHMMEPMLAPFIDEVRKVDLAPPKIPYVSNVTGTWITAADATSPDYWARHLRQMVRFAEGLNELSKEPDRILLQVGPGRTLSLAARKQQNNASGRVVISSLPREHEPDSATAVMLNGLGQLWLAGIEVHWSGFSARERRHRVPLPSYPFERQRYWIEPRQLQYNAEPCQITEVDQHATPAFDCERPALETVFLAPRTPLESLIAEVWQDVLGLEKVSVDDDFFKMGGHSLLASQVMTRLRKALDLELPLNKLFETPTVADQAAYLETVRWVALQGFGRGTTDDREEDLI